MRKLTFLTAFFMLANFAFGGGLLTNSNQSVQYIRMLSRNASLDIDAVYYNPAGLIKLEDGWHFAVSNQTIFQDKNVDSGYLLLNDAKYQGTVFVPFYPNAYAVYKKEKWAFSLGFGPNAGGGSAEFKRGLPSFEIPISQLGAGLKQLGTLMSISGLPAVTGYDADLYFTGSSIFWGLQLGATYEINEKLSVFAGVRYMPAKNVYQGSIKNIMVGTTAGEMSASNYLQLTDPVLAGTINLLGVASGGLQAGIDAGLVDPNGPVTNPQVLQIMGLLGVTNPTNQQAVGVMTGAKTNIQTLKDADVSDKFVDTEQTGAGFTPILGLNFSPNDDWNIGIKYENKTYMTLENNTTVDDLDLFPNGNKNRSDIPAILGIGVGYKGLDWLEAQVSYTQYFSKRVDWGMNVRDLSSWREVDQTKIRHREVEKSDYELGLGLQFNVLDNFAFSVGGLYGAMKPADSYQSDFSYTNPFFTIGAGVMWQVTEKIKLDAGFFNVFYQDQTVTFVDPVIPSYQDTYGITAMTFAAGLSFSIF